MSPSFTWLSQSSWVLLLQALTCGLDPPSTPCAVQRGGRKAWLLPDLVRQVELPGQESQRARLPERKGKRRAPERSQEAGGESPGGQRRALGSSVPTGERRKGQEGLGGEHPRTDRRDRVGLEVRVLQG